MAVSVVVLEERMVTFLLIVDAVDVVLGSISGLYVRQKAIVCREKVIGSLPRKHHIRLVALIVQHKLLG